jgi:SAM-dependent methyltransferase
LGKLREGAAKTPYVTPPQYAAAFREVYAQALGAPAAASTGPRAARQPDRPSGADLGAAAGNADFRWAPRRSDRRDHGEVFSDIYARDLWRLGGESSSGPGSRREHTQRLRIELPRLLSRLGIRRLLDIGCGDFNWMRETQLGVDLYIGVDVVFDVVLANRLRYGSARRRFLLRDITRDPLPRADLVLCRDVLIHFPNDDLVTALQAIIASGSRYLLAGTYTGRAQNKPIVLGDWRPVNLQLAPLSLPPPIEALVETPAEEGYDDKRLALWDLRELRSG